MDGANLPSFPPHRADLRARCKAEFDGFMHTYLLDGSSRRACIYSRTAFRNGAVRREERRRLPNTLSFNAFVEHSPWQETHSSPIFLLYSQRTHMRGIYLS